MKAEIKRVNAILDAEGVNDRFTYLDGEPNKDMLACGKLHAYLASNAVRLEATLVVGLWGHLTLQYHLHTKHGSSPAAERVNIRKADATAWENLFTTLYGQMVHHRLNSKSA